MLGLRSSEPVKHSLARVVRWSHSGADPRFCRVGTRDIRTGGRTPTLGRLELQNQLGIGADQRTRDRRGRLPSRSREGWCEDGRSSGARVCRGRPGAQLTEARPGRIYLPTSSSPNSVAASQVRSS